MNSLAARGSSSSVPFTQSCNSGVAEGSMCGGMAGDTWLLQTQGTRQSRDLQPGLCSALSGPQPSLHLVPAVIGCHRSYGSSLQLCWQSPACSLLRYGGIRKGFRQYIVRISSWILHLVCAPLSVHRRDGARLMSSYSISCFSFIVQYVALGLIYCTLFKSCSEGRINNSALNHLNIGVLHKH